MWAKLLPFASCQWFKEPSKGVLWEKGFYSLVMCSDENWFRSPNYIYFKTGWVEPPKFLILSALSMIWYCNLTYTFTPPQKDSLTSQENCFPLVSSIKLTLRIKDAVLSLTKVETGVKSVQLWSLSDVAVTTWCKVWTVFNKTLRSKVRVRSCCKPFLPHSHTSPRYQSLMFLRWGATEGLFSAPEQRAPEH